LSEEIPTACDRGTKCNAQGYKNSWSGYKLHLDTADCGVPIPALLSSASMHVSLAAIPISPTLASAATRTGRKIDKIRLSHSALSNLAVFRTQVRQAARLLATGGGWRQSPPQPPPLQPSPDDESPSPELPLQPPPQPGARR